MYYRVSSYFNYVVVMRVRTTDLKLARLPTRSLLSFAALPSISLFPLARFTDAMDYQDDEARMANGELVDGLSDS